MNLAICSLSSGSSGNCYVISSNEGCVIVDAGISAKKIREGLKNLGLTPQELSGILITHEHSDHVQGLAVLAKKEGAHVYGTERTLKCIPKLSEEGFLLHPVKKGESFEIADMKIGCFAVSHDAADPCGYTISCGPAKICIVTDTGYVSDEIRSCMAGADLLVLESNHDENILRVGRYPYFLKQRILSDKGHLSNETAARVLAEILEDEEQCGKRQTKQVLLAHLSKENNFPEMALATMENVLMNAGFACGKQLKIDVLPRSEMSSVYVI